MTATISTALNQEHRNRMQTGECCVEIVAEGRPRQAGPGKPLGPTPLRPFAHGECANAQAEDGCLFRSDGCLVVRGRRCRYFESCVLPLLTRCASARCLQLYPEAADAYLALHPELCGKVRSAQTRLCQCGAPLRKWRHYCDACATVRRRTSHREHSRASRGQKIQKSAQIPSETQAVFGPADETRGIGQRTPEARVFCPRAASEEAIR